jgi:hypothetical protein
MFAAILATAARFEPATSALVGMPATFEKAARCAMCGLIGLLSSDRCGAECWILLTARRFVEIDPDHTACRRPSK